jgi:hypothetical protein
LQSRNLSTDPFPRLWVSHQTKENVSQRNGRRVSACKEDVEELTAQDASINAFFRHLMDEYVLPVWVYALFRVFFCIIFLVSMS